MKRISVCILLLFLPVTVFTQSDTNSTVSQLGGEGYREGQYPGLGKAASDIFYSDKRISFSGYAEVSGVIASSGPRDISSGDVELYFNQLYRAVPFIGVRITKNWFWITEFGMEHVVGNNETHSVFFPESYMDYIYLKWLNIRVGIQPLNIGYINNNDEPLLFLSVNRPETERLIVPTEWIETGATFYGEIGPKFTYFIGFTNGVIAKDFRSPTWIREGAQGQLYSFNKVATHAQLNYLPNKQLTVSISTYYNQSGRGKTLKQHSNNISAPLNLYTGYVRWDKKGFSFITMGVFGSLQQTTELYLLTQQEQGEAQVLGEQTYGYYFEPSFDILTLFHLPKKEEKDKLISYENPQLPIFIRYESLDTHAKVNEKLSHLPFTRTHMGVVTMGLNFRPNPNVALKMDVQFKNKRSPVIGTPNNETLVNLGLGIEF